MHLSWPNVGRKICTITLLYTPLGFVVGIVFLVRVMWVILHVCLHETLPERVLLVCCPATGWTVLLDGDAVSKLRRCGFAIESIHRRGKFLLVRLSVEYCQPKHPLVLHFDHII